jgi:hypothetical protein
LGFYAQARAFLEKYVAIRWYLRYLTNFACNEGWSGQLESEASGPHDAWEKLACVAYSKSLANPQTFIRMSDAGYPIPDRVDIETPWGAIQTKPAGVDAFVVVDERENGEKMLYMVHMDGDGSPVGYTKA